MCFSRFVRFAISHSTRIIRRMIFSVILKLSIGDDDIYCENCLSNGNDDVMNEDHDY